MAAVALPPSFPVDEEVPAPPALVRKRRVKQAVVEENDATAAAPAPPEVLRVDPAPRRRRVQRPVLIEEDNPEEGTAAAIVVPRKAVAVPPAATIERVASSIRVETDEVHTDPSPAALPDVRSTTPPAVEEVQTSPTTEQHIDTPIAEPTEDSTTLDDSRRLSESEPVTNPEEPALEFRGTVDSPSETTSVDPETRPLALETPVRPGSPGINPSQGSEPNDGTNSEEASDELGTGVAVDEDTRDEASEIGDLVADSPTVQHPASAPLADLTERRLALESRGGGRAFTPTDGVDAVVNDTIMTHAEVSAPPESPDGKPRRPTQRQPKAVVARPLAAQVLPPPLTPSPPSTLNDSRIPTPLGDASISPSHMDRSLSPDSSVASPNSTEHSLEHSIMISTTDPPAMNGTSVSSQPSSPTSQGGDTSANSPPSPSAASSPTLQDTPRSSPGTPRQPFFQESPSQASTASNPSPADVSPSSAPSSPSNLSSDPKTASLSTARPLFDDAEETTDPTSAPSSPLALPQDADRNVTPTEPALASRSPTPAVEASAPRSPTPTFPASPSPHESMTDEATTDPTPTTESPASPTPTFPSSPTISQPSVDDARVAESPPSPLALEASVRPGSPGTGPDEANQASEPENSTPSSNQLEEEARVASPEVTPTTVPTVAPITVDALHDEAVSIERGSQESEDAPAEDEGEAVMHQPLTSPTLENQEKEAPSTPSDPSPTDVPPGTHELPPSTTDQPTTSALSLTTPQETPAPVMLSPTARKLLLEEHARGMEEIQQHEGDVRGVICSAAAAVPPAPRPTSRPGSWRTTRAASRRLTPPPGSNVNAAPESTGRAATPPAPGGWLFDTAWSDDGDEWGDGTPTTTRRKKPKLEEFLLLEKAKTEQRRREMAAKLERQRRRKAKEEEAERQRKEEEELAKERKKAERAVQRSRRHRLLEERAKIRQKEQAAELQKRQHNEAAVLNKTVLQREAKFICDSRLDPKDSYEKARQRRREDVGLAYPPPPRHFRPTATVTMLREHRASESPRVISTTVAAVRPPSGPSLRALRQPSREATPPALDPAALSAPATPTSVPDESRHSPASSQSGTPATSRPGSRASTIPTSGGNTPVYSSDSAQESDPSASNSEKGSRSPASSRASSRSSSSSSSSSARSLARSRSRSRSRSSARESSTSSRGSDKEDPMNTTCQTQPDDAPPMLPRDPALSLRSSHGPRSRPSSGPGPVRGAKRISIQRSPKGAPPPGRPRRHSSVASSPAVSKRGKGRPSLVPRPPSGR